MKPLPPPKSYREWQEEQRLLQIKEDAYKNSFNQFQKLIDSHIGFISFLIVLHPICFAVGTLIGLTISR